MSSILTTHVLPSLSQVLDPLRRKRLTASSKQTQFWCPSMREFGPTQTSISTPGSSLPAAVAFGGCWRGRMRPETSTLFGIRTTE